MCRSTPPDEVFPACPTPEQRLLDRVLAVSLLGGEHRADDAAEPALTGTRALNKVGLMHGKVPPLYRYTC